MIFDLTNEEATHLINVLGELPTKMNVFPIAVKLQQQMQFQSDVIANVIVDNKGETVHGDPVRKE